MIFCVHTQEGKGLIVSGTERHEHLFVVRTCMYVRLRQLWVFVTTLLKMGCYGTP